jgi:tetratricopeptide (TPR) repeat protein
LSIVKRYSTGKRTARLIGGLWLFAAVLGCWVAPVEAARGGMKPLEYKQAYRGVLAVLAGGESERALAELAELEQRATGEEEAWRFLDNLWRLKLQVIRDLLANRSPDLLMPIIMLHHDAYFLYTELDRPYLAQHSRTMASELAEVYAERAGTAGAATFAGWTLSSFGAYLWSPSNIGGSADLFYRTFLVDPDNEVALRGLAAAYERAGDYPKAIEYLRLALAQEPGDAEIRLRLALCEIRQDAHAAEAVMSSLTQLTGEQHPEWIRSIAYQESTRIHLQGGDIEAAEALLRQGLEDLPGDQQLSLQLAMILESKRRRSESLATLQAIRIDGWERDSPRLIYDFWTPPELGTVRGELRQEMQKGSGVLAASLAAPAGAEAD